MDTQTRWWFGADRKWHRGKPPSGWWQASDRRWYPPKETPDERVITTGPRHMASDATVWDDDDEQPRWTDIGIPAALAVLVLAVVVIGILWVRSFSAIGNERSLEAEPAQDGLETTATTAARTLVPGADTSATTDAAAADDDEDSGATDEDIDADGSTGDRRLVPFDVRITQSRGSSSTSGSGGGDSSSTSSSSSSSTSSSSTSPSTGGRSDDCPPWTPPGNPDHPVAPGKVDRDNCD